MMHTVNPRKTQSIRPLGPVDVSALKAAMLAMPEEVWARENADKPNKFDALDVTMHVPFRFVSNFDDWRFSHDMPLWSRWRQLIEPVLAAATKAYGYQRGAFPRIMFARMPPGGVVHPHRDANPSARWPHKIHVPLQTNPDVAFVIEGSAYHIPEGQAVEVNNMGVHAVYNRGVASRTHLIFEYYDLDQPEPSWIRELTGTEVRV